MISRLAGWRGLAALAASAPLLGCAIGPDYLRPAAIVPAQYKEMKGWKLSSPRDDFAKGDWWKVFGDRELDLLEILVWPGINDTRRWALARGNLRHPSGTLQVFAGHEGPVIHESFGQLRDDLTIER